MKHLIFISIFSFLSLSSCNNAKKINSSINQVNITIEQNEMVVMPSNGVYQLDRRAFNVVIDFPKPMAVMVNTSFSNHIAVDRKPLASRQEFRKENAMAVSLFNEERTIYVSEESSSPWYYENEQSNNFNDIQTQNSRYRCIRTIKYFQENTSTKSNIERIIAPLFLTVVPDVVFEVNPDSIEVLGKSLKIEWNETQPETAANAMEGESQSLDAHLEAIKAENAQIAAMDLAEENDSQFNSLVQKVIAQLEIDEQAVDVDFIVSKVQPNNPKETIIVIPEIVEEAEDYLRFDGHLLIVNSETGKIINQYYDRDAWESDAIMLSEISIDTAPYNISEDNRAFGIRANYHNMSQPNPYSNTTLSLFIESENNLERILNNYDVNNYGAEWDTRCAGQSIDNKKTLIMMANKTNGHYDILVRDEVTATESFEDENGECNSTEEIEVLKTVLKFNGEEYTENGMFRPLDVYLDDHGESETNIRQTPNGKVIQKINDADDYYTLTITEAKNGWFKLVNIMGVEGDNVEVSEEEAWIHHSVIGMATRRNIKLFDAPGSAVVVGTIKQEIGLRIKDKYLDWVQIEYNGLTGWIESTWLCGNPVSTCP